MEAVEPFQRPPRNPGLIPVPKTAEIRASGLNRGYLPKLFQIWMSCERRDPTRIR